ncbi:MAG: cytochrome d ubiquinol oxidase subunit II [Ilumatobacteraceae bacterium]
MSAAQAALAVTWIGVTLYALFGGADFGAGFWDLVAGGADRGRSPRRLIERVIAPVWEANHVWLIFVLVMLWTCFPPVFAAVASSLYQPLTLAAVGIILRGAGFAIRKTMHDLVEQRFFGAVFATSSVMTPYALARSPARWPRVARRWATPKPTRGPRGSTRRACSEACSRWACVPTSPRCSSATTRWWPETTISSTTSGAEQP